MNTTLLDKVKSYVENLLLHESPPTHVYHDLNHTVETVEMIEVIGNGENLNDEEMEITLLAGWFHDTGHLKTWKDHEYESQKIAKEFLEKSSYPLEKIELVLSTILATKMPQEPKNKMEMVICDADLSHLGRKGYNSKSDKLRLEYETRKNTIFKEIEWLEENIKFFKRHKFHTDYAAKNFEDRKQKNFIKVQEKLRDSESKSDDKKYKREKLEIEKAKLKNKDASKKRADRGIETMFRNVMRTHVSFSSMADSKANIMISVNTLLLTAIVAVLVRKLDVNQHLIIPTIIITLVSMVTLVFAVLVTRPKITEGKFTKDDIEKKKANLLFFGNFYNMDLDNFTWGMRQTINDKEYLYDSMIKDFYFLGQVLGKKYKYLRVCYSIFMYGLIISIFAFAISILLYPSGINPERQLNQDSIEQNDSFDLRDIIE